jgi:Fe-S cluster biogenesis protein NfuA
LREKVAQAVVELEPRLEDLVEGHVELMEVDEEKRIVTLKLIGGRLHWCGEFALGLWAEKLLKEKVPEVKDVLGIDASLIALRELNKQLSGWKVD